nr:DeoR/GlpR family DNA-binding transcription regulator [Luteimicrobium album]
MSARGRTRRRSRGEPGGTQTDGPAARGTSRDHPRARERGADTSVTGLSQEFDVTASTIRRDLAQLNQEGLLVRVLGGALAPIEREPSLNERLGAAYAEKRAIARCAVASLEENDVLYLDAGSTVAAAAEELRSARRPAGLTVVTTSVAVLEILGGVDQVTLYCTGGLFRSTSGALLGAQAEAMVRSFHFDRAFFGADGVDPKLGLCEAELSQTALKELVASRSTHVTVLAHSAKLLTRPFPYWATLPTPWQVVTEAASPEVTARFHEAGVGLVEAVQRVAPSAGGSAA